MTDDQKFIISLIKEIDPKMRCETFDSSTDNVYIDYKGRVWLEDGDICYCAHPFHGDMIKQTFDLTKPEVDPIKWLRKTIKEAGR